MGYVAIYVCVTMSTKDCYRRRLRRVIAAPPNISQRIWQEMMEFKAEIIAYQCQTLLSSEHCLKSGAVISVLNSARSAPPKLLKHMTEWSPIFGTACSYLFTLATEGTRKSVEKHDGIGANSS